MIRLGICSDDIKVLKLLQGMIAEQYGCQIQTYSYRSSEELLLQCDKTGYVPLDIVFVDITLKREKGVELAHRLQMRSHRVKIIFVTDYLESVADGEGIEPLYLLKRPISVFKLVEMIDKAIGKIQIEEAQAVTLHSKGMVYRIPSKYISYIEANNRKLFVHQNEDVISVYMKMDEMEEKIGEVFLRCHHSYLVNMNYIKSFSMQEIELLNGTKIPVSRPKSGMARSRFLAYLGEEI